MGWRIGTVSSCLLLLLMGIDRSREDRMRWKFRTNKSRSIRRLKRLNFRFLLHRYRETEPFGLHRRFRIEWYSYLYNQGSFCQEKVNIGVIVQIKPIM